MSLQEWKQEAEELVARKDFLAAAEVYARLAQAYPDQPIFLLRAGQQYRRLDATDSAIYWYTIAAQVYAKSGQWAKAMATAKAILELDPLHKESEALLARLYASRSRAPRVAPEPKPASDEPRVSVELLDEYEPPPETDDYFFYGAVDFGDSQEEEEEILLLEDESSPDADDEIIEGSVTEVSLDELLERLPRIPLFSELTAPEFERLLESIDVKYFEAGGQVLREGEPGDAFYIVTTGEATVSKRDSSGRDVNVAQLGEGTFFGEFAYLTGSPRTATISAATELEVLEIHRAGMDRLVQEFPRVREVLGQYYRRRVIKNLLMVSPVFEALSEADRRRLLKRFTYLPVSAGRQILKQGDVGKGLYVVARGRVSVQHEDPDGATRTIAILGSGDFFGEMSLLSGETVSASVYAEEKTGLLRLPQEQFAEVSQAFPALLRVLASFAAERTIENAG